jgi:malate permease and related proteins
MITTFTMTLLQIVKLFILILCGYILRKKALLPESAGFVLGKLEVLIFLPALIFRTMANNFDLDVLRTEYSLLTVSLAVLVVTFLLSRLIARLYTDDRNMRELYSYLYVIPNFGYFGYPLVTAIFGEAMLFQYMVYVIPFQVYIYTVGIYTLNPERKFNVKSVISPALIAIFSGIVFGSLGVPVPSFLNDVLTLGANCMAPVAMLLMGFVLGAYKPKELLAGITPHLSSLLRLLVIPLALFGVLYLLGIPDQTILIGVIFLSMPFGLNAVIFPQSKGWDTAEGAQLCFVSSLYSVLTLPLIISFLMTVLTP